jgi:hypothetical protein
MLVLSLDWGGMAVWIRRIVATVAAVGALGLLGAGVASAATAIEYGLAVHSTAVGQ